MHRIFADVVLVLHTTYVAFVVFGLLLTAIGAVRQWKWIRNAWFRGIHLSCVVFVVGLAWAGKICPLTIWENLLRERSGGSGYANGFIQHWLHQLLFYDFEPATFTFAYTLFAITVVGTWVLAPPNLIRGRVKR